jgi:hypothetical protein
MESRIGRSGRHAETDAVANPSATRRENTEFETVDPEIKFSIQKQVAAGGRVKLRFAPPPENLDHGTDADAYKRKDCEQFHTI